MARRGRSRSLANPVFHKPARLGCDAVRRLHDEVVQPIATPATKGAWYKQWRLVSLDGSTLDVVDEPALDAAFGRPGAGHGKSAYPHSFFQCGPDTRPIRDRGRRTGCSWAPRLSG